jgi:hypothetical protein
VGDFPWRELRHSGHGSIRATTLPHVSHEACRRTQYPDDDDSDSRRHSDGDEYRAEAWDELDK